MLCFALYAASRAMTDVYRPLLENLGLTYPQFLVMVVLWEHGTCRVKDLGRLLRLDVGTLSPLLKRLEAAHFLKRERNTSDERVVNVSLTEKGHAIEKDAIAVGFNVLSKNGLTLDAYFDLLSQLKKLTTALAASA
jgi:DNA-binding MarR family transcriptional regulator